MHELKDDELYKAIQHTKTIDEQAGKLIIENFHAEQPVLAHTLFNLFSAMIAEQNQAMAHLFMDLCFDVICVYQYAFGDIPTESDEWLTKQTALMDAELKSLMSKKKKKNKRSGYEVNQKGLIKFMNDSIDDYASEVSGSIAAIKLTKTMVFVTIKLFNNLYNQVKLN